MANRDKILSDFSAKFKQNKKFHLHEDESRRGRKRKDFRDLNKKMIKEWEMEEDTDR